MSNSLSASKKVKGIQSDSRLEIRWINKNFLLFFYLPFFKMDVVFDAIYFFKADLELFIGFWANFYSLKNSWWIKYGDWLKSILISKSKQKKFQIFCIAQINHFVPKSENSNFFGFDFEIRIDLSQSCYLICQEFFSE